MSSTPITFLFPLFFTWNNKTNYFSLGVASRMAKYPTKPQQNVSQWKRGGKRNPNWLVWCGMCNLVTRLFDLAASSDERAWERGCGMWILIHAITFPPWCCRWSAVSATRRASGTWPSTTHLWRTAPWRRGKWIVKYLTNKLKLSNLR